MHYVYTKQINCKASLYHESKQCGEEKREIFASLM